MINYSLLKTLKVLAIVTASYTKNGSQILSRRQLKIELSIISSGQKSTFGMLVERDLLVDDGFTIKTATISAINKMTLTLMVTASQAMILSKK